MIFEAELIVLVWGIAAKIKANFPESLHLLYFFKVPSPQNAVSMYLTKTSVCWCMLGMLLMRVPGSVPDPHPCFSYLGCYYLVGGWKEGRCPVLPTQILLVELF